MLFAPKVAMFHRYPLFLFVINIWPTIVTPMKFFVEISLAYVLLAGGVSRRNSFGCKFLVAESFCRWFIWPTFLGDHIVCIILLSCCLNASRSILAYGRIQLSLSSLWRLFFLLMLDNLKAKCYST